MSVNGPSKTVRDGLVLALDAGNAKSYIGSGNIWKDLSGNNNGGTLNNSPTFSGANGGSIVFDGIDDYVTFLTSAAITSSLSLYNVTMEVCFMQTTAASSQNIFFIGNPGASGFGFYIGPCASESNRLGLVHGGSICYRVSYLGIVTNTWYHAVYVKGSSNDNYLYINGVLHQTEVGNFSTPSNSVVMGAYGGTERFTGRISTARLYNRALSANEIKQNYNTTKRRFGLS